MMDMEDFQLGERLVGILHLWEIQAGAINKPRIHQIAESNRDIGIVIAYHYMVGEDNYETKIRISWEHFTPQEAELFKRTYDG